MNGEVKIVDDVPAAFAEHVKDAYQQRFHVEHFTLVLSGGSTARPCYEQLVRAPVDWSAITAVWGDERCVPLDDPDSNYLLAKEALLDQVTPLLNVYPMRAQDGAAGYQRIIEELLPLDVVHLGVGDDGHTASLFPGSAALNAPAGQLVVETGDDFHPHPRLSLTFNAIAQSELVLFTVMGEKKAPIFRRIKDGEPLPAGLVTAKRVVWLVDPAAAGG